jgi:hypothetical protein
VVVALVAPAVQEHLDKEVLVEVVQARGLTMVEVAAAVHLL